MTSEEAAEVARLGSDINSLAPPKRKEVPKAGSHKDDKTQVISPCLAVIFHHLMNITQHPRGTDPRGLCILGTSFKQISDPATEDA